VAAGRKYVEQFGLRQSGRTTSAGWAIGGVGGIICFTTALQQQHIKHKRKDEEQKTEQSQKPAGLYHKLGFVANYKPGSLRTIVE
jgi:hypothetical protein